MAPNRLNLVGMFLALAVSGPAVQASGPVGRDPNGLPLLIRSARSGPWSSPSTWEGGKLPSPGSRVQIRAGDRVLYDISSGQAIRSVHVAGTLAFAADRDTRLDVGLLKIQPGSDASENGFDCDAHVAAAGAGEPRPALEVGAPGQPIEPRHTALIRLTYFEGMDKESCPAIVCCGGRMEFHGAPMSRTWLKLGATAQAGDSTITLAEPGPPLRGGAPGWRAGDRIIVTATQRERRERGTFRPGVHFDPTAAPPVIRILNRSDNSATGKAAAGDGERPARLPEGAGRKREAGEKAGSSPTPRLFNPEGLVGQPMQPFTEERTIQAIHGATLTLDRPLTYHHLGTGEYRGEVADLSRNVIVESADPAGVRGHTMYHRGSQGSISYAEFRHLGKEGVLGRYSLHFHLVGDTMRGSSVVGASIWDSANRWLTIHGTNYLVVRDCVGYQSIGHGFYVEDGSEVYNVFDRNLAVQAFTGKPLPKQNLPFDHNDGAGFWWANSLNSFTRNVACECDRYGFRFEATPTDGFDLHRPVQQPDGSSKPIDIRTLPFLLCEGNEAHTEVYGFNLGEGVDKVGPDEKHPFVIRNTKVWNTHWAFRPESPSVLVDGMEIYSSVYGLYRPFYDHHSYSRLSISQTGNPEAFGTGQKPEGLEFPNIRQAFLQREKETIQRLRAEGKGPEGGRPFSRIDDPLASTEPYPACGPLASAAFPRPLEPIDDLPPVTVITEVGKPARGKLVVRGTTCDNGTVKRVLVNGREARPLAPNFSEWEVTLDHLRPGDLKLTASAEDAAGNREQTPHELVVAVSR